MYNRDSKIMRKLLGKSATDTGSADLSSANNTSSPSSTILFRPTRSQNAVYATGGIPITCLDVSPDQRSAALAGSHILKTIRLDDADQSGSTTPGSFQFHEGTDLRASLTSQPSSGSRASVVADQLNIKDVKWHGNSTIFTACANGRIFAYDVTRIGNPGAEPLEYVQIQEDSRQVNTLDVNPHLKSWVLSGSQDGMARVFDASTPWHNRAGYLTFRQRFAPLRCIDSIRQVKWSPKVGHEMAACTETGVILKWDVRQPSRPLVRVNGHEKVCTSIAWHPDGTHLISAGWDSKLHVWDFGNSADKRQKPKWTIPTPAPVSTVCWRPGLWSATAQSKRAAQVAVTYDETTNRRYGSSVVHIWDLARPTMPYREIDRFESSPTGLYWRDQDLLWTVGNDGVFNQCDVAFSARVLDRQTMSTMDFSPRGDAVVFLDERPTPHRPRLSSGTAYPSEAIVRGSYGSSTIPMLSVSKSDSEEDVGSFLGSKRRTRKRRPSGRGQQLMNPTPPSIPPSSGEDGISILGLEQALKSSGTFRTQQAMASGHVPGAKSPAAYQYLSSVYLETLFRDLPKGETELSLAQRVGNIMETFAKAAEAVSQFRLAQTWRILAFGVDLLLRRRAHYHLETRIARFSKMKIGAKTGGHKHSLPGALFDSIHSHDSNVTDMPLRAATHINHDRLAHKSLLSEEVESTSNQATPIARPVDAVGVVATRDHFYQAKKLQHIVEPPSLSIGAAAHGSYGDIDSPRKRLDSEPLSVSSQQSDPVQTPSTEGYGFYDMENLAQAVGIPTGSSSTQGTAYPRPMPPRQDSIQSYGMFSTSGGTKMSGQSSGSADSWEPSPRKSAISPKEGPEVDEEDEDYHSRIRGEELQNSVTNGEKGVLERREDSPEEVFMISQTTALSDEIMLPSQISVESDIAPSIQLSLHGEVSPPHPPHDDRNPSPQKTLSLEFSSEPTIIDNDYLPWGGDAPYPYPLSPDAPKSIRTPLTPLDPYMLIDRALSFETRTSVLNASAIVLLLKPLTPTGIIDSHRASSILRQHHSRLMGMSLFVEASLLRKLCIQGWPEGLPGWGDSYSAVYTPAQHNVKVGFFCSSCRKARETDVEDDESAIWTCKKCKATMAPCAVCNHRNPEPASFARELDPSMLSGASSEAALSEWWYCPSCSHGGHASCLTAWHSAIDASEPVTASSVSSPSASSVLSSLADTFSSGCCPLDGCGHACLPGRYRHEQSVTRSDELGKAASASALMEMVSPRTSHSDLRQQAGRRSSAANSRRTSPHQSMGGVRSDGNEVTQSKAVGVARESLIQSGKTPNGSPGPGRERRKSVKFKEEEM